MASEHARRLDSWKEIAAFFSRDERTVKRWEKERGLPVHRLPGGSKARVFAYAEELAAWSTSPAHVAEEVAGPVQAPAPARISRLSWVLIASLSAVALAVVAITLNYPLGTHRAGAHTTNPEAEDLYLKGRYHWNKRTPEDLTKAVDFFTQAIVHDPGYAKAYAGLADTYNLLREFSLMPSNEAFSRSLAAAKRAVELDDGLAEAHNSLAFASFYGAWDFGTAEREFKRAVELDPNYATAYHWYATALMSLGRFPEALANITRAQRLDTASASILADKGLVLFYAGQREAGIALLKHVSATDPAFQSPHSYLQAIYLIGHDYPNYLAEGKAWGQLSRDPDSQAVVTAAENGFAARGSRGMLEAMLELQKTLYARGRLPAYSVAQTCSLMGNKSEALAYLRAALEKHEMTLVVLRIDPSFASLHAEPRFAELVARVGLPAAQ